jgi:hypothetical protein
MPNGQFEIQRTGKSGLPLDRYRIKELTFVGLFIFDPGLIYVPFAIVRRECAKKHANGKPG